MDTEKERFHFKCWLLEMDEVLAHFFRLIPISSRPALNFTPESLDILEDFLLENYPDMRTLLGPDEKQILDGANRYVGETFRRTLFGNWVMELDNRKAPYFAMPAVTGFNGTAAACPLAIVTHALNTRTHQTLRKNLENLLAARI